MDQWNSKIIHFSNTLRLWISLERQKMQVQQYLMAPRNKMQSWQLQSSENKCFCKLIRALVIE